MTRKKRPLLSERVIVGLEMMVDWITTDPAYVGRESDDVAAAQRWVSRAVLAHHDEKDREARRALRKKERLRIAKRNGRRP